MRKPNYDKFPSTKFEGTIVQGWDAIKTQLQEVMKYPVV
jgi:hypothetical protein